MNADFVPIKYMGSKRSLAPKIARKISSEHPIATVLDVFSCMCAVGTEIVGRHPLFTNDVHAFAEIVAESLFVANDQAPSAHEISRFLAAYERNRRALAEALGRKLARERNAIAHLTDSEDWKKL